MNVLGVRGVRSPRSVAPGPVVSRENKAEADGRTGMRRSAGATSRRISTYAGRGMSAAPKPGQSAKLASDNARSRVADPLQRDASPDRFTPARGSAGGQWAASSALASTRGGETVYKPEVRTHPDRERIVAHESVHRMQHQAEGLPRGSRDQLEADARRGASSILAGAAYEPKFSAPTAMVLAYEPTDWLPNIEEQSRREQQELERAGLTDPTNEARLGTAHQEAGDAARIRYESSVTATGDGASVDTTTVVQVDYEQDRTVSLLGQPTIQINPEMGLAPTHEAPAYPYTLTYSRTLHYTDADGRSATVEIDGNVWFSEETWHNQVVGAQPSFEALLGLRGDGGYVSASIRGQSSVTGYFANYAAHGVSLNIQSEGAIDGLGRSGGWSFISPSVGAHFLNPRMTAGKQHDTLHTYLLSVDAAELLRRLEQEMARDHDSSWFDELGRSLADLLSDVAEPIVNMLDDAATAISEWWNDLPPWARGVLTAVAKFAVAIGAMAAVAGLIVLAAKGAIAFGTAMLIVGAIALTVGFVMSFVHRVQEAWHSGDLYSFQSVPLIALLDTIGVSGVIEAITDRSLLTGTPLARSEEERWEAGTTGTLQLIGIFLMARGLRGGRTSGGRTVAPEARGNMADFHALPRERLPVLPEGHYWSRQGAEWTIYREPTAPEVPLEISIYSDGQGRINYNVRTGERVLQGDTMTRPSGGTYPRGRQRLPEQLRDVGEENPFIEEGTGRLYEKGHITDYADTLEGPGVRNSNLDPANFTPQARFWNSFLRNHLVGRIRGRGGGYREMPVYDQVPARTANNTPIPREFIFVETSPTGQPVQAWRIPNDPALTTRSQSQLPQYEIPLSEVPQAIIRSDGTVTAPGSKVGPIVVTGQRGDQEQP